MAAVALHGPSNRLNYRQQSLFKESVQDHTSLFHGRDILHTSLSGLGGGGRGQTLARGPLGSVWGPGGIASGSPR